MTTGKRGGAGRTMPAAGILLAAAVLLAGCGEKGKPGRAAEPPAVTGVETVVVAASPREKFAEAVGTVRAVNVAAVAPQVMGRVTSVLVTEGSSVEKGTVLATIDDEANRARLVAAEGARLEADAARDEAERAVAQAEAGKVLAEKTFDRFERLLAEKVVTRQEFDEVEARKTVAVKDYERALERRAQMAARVVQAKAGENAARTALSYTRVTAPFTGIVTEKKIDAGSMAVPGVPIVVMEDARRYRIEASVPETLLPLLRLGAPVEVLLDSIPGKTITAKISEISPLVDPSTRTFTAKADIRGPGLRTGLYGRVRIRSGKGNVLAVPKRAITRAGGYEGLYVVTADNTARLVLVTTGDAYGEDVEILSGIGPGARVAVSGVERLADGARVELRR
ncbi:MAG: efflux RND transporter periplasmic adaptor subunit [Gemmatimonadota bacterium]